MLHLHRSNRYEILRERCLHDLLQHARRPDIDALQPLTVVVPNQGVLDDLRRAWADRHGVAAGLHMPFAGQWLWPLAMRWVDDSRALMAGASAWTAAAPVAAQRLVWPIWHALHDRAWLASQPRLDAWVRSRDALGVFELAHQLAELFERYANHRHDWLTRWARPGAGAHGVEPDHDQAAWQAALWRRVAQGLGLDRAHPFVTALHALHAALPPHDGSILPAAVHVFMPGAMPPLHVDLWHALATQVDVHAYLLDPCQAFWYDTVSPRQLARLQQRGRAAQHEVGHALLNAWGTGLQHSLGKWQDPPADVHWQDHEHFAAPSAGHRLAQLQRSILEFEPLNPGALVHQPNDRSLEVHVAHSLTRQAEVLHDRLLDLLGQDASLQLSDIVVLVPQLGPAAPLLDAAFAGVPDALRLPWQISGQGGQTPSLCAQALLALLQLAQGRLQGPQLSDWLHLPAVSAAWQLTAHTIEALADGLRAAGFRWGWDAAHRQQAIAEASPNPPPAHAAHGPTNTSGTLDHALQRLLLRHCLGPSVPSAVSDLASAAATAGPDLAQLAHLGPRLQALREWCAQASVAHTLAEWIALLQHALAHWVGPGPLGAQAHGALWSDAQALAASLRSLQVDAELAMAGAAALPGHDAPPLLPPGAIAALLRQRWEALPPGAAARGAITVAPLSALAGLPFRVVAVLGLDDGVLGAKRPAAELDLMAVHPAPGDPHAATTDRSHLLAALLGARDLLWLGYSGRTAHDHTERPPSVVLAELIDAVLGATRLADAPSASPQALRESLIVEHPAQPFSPRAFNMPDALGRRPDARLHSFRADMAPPNTLATPHTSIATEAEGDDAQSGALAAPEVPSDDSLDDPLDDTPDDTLVEPALAGPRFVRTALPLPLRERADPLDVAQLQATLGDPARDFARRRLGLELPERVYPWPDTEPLALPLGKGEWHSADRQQLLQMVLALVQPQTQLDLDGLTQALTHAITTSGLLPAAVDRAAVAAQAHATIWPALRTWWQLGGPHARAWPLRGPWVGRTQAIGPRGPVQLSAFPLRGPGLLKGWIAHLAACAAGVANASQPAWLIDLDGVWQLQAPSGSAADLAAQLAALAQLADRAERQPLPLFVQPQWLALTGASATDVHQAWEREALRPATRLVWRGHADLRQCADPALAQQVLGPLQQHAQHIVMADVPSYLRQAGVNTSQL
jgi:exodeoxyribonuclease V gamma subunit